MATETCPVCVLLIEDDEKWREMIAAFLEARGYATVVAEDGEQALDLLPDLQRPCLVLVDALTIRVDYDQLFAALGANDRMATLPMILISLSAPDLFCRPAVIKRPVDMDILFRMVQTHCCGGRGGGRRVEGDDRLRSYR